MTKELRRFLFAACAVALFSIPSSAQSAERAPNVTGPQTADQMPSTPANLSPVEAVANEIGLLRRSLQTLNLRLREITEKNLAPDAKPAALSKDQQHPIAVALDLLSRAEQRAEGLRKQLLETTEKETSFKNRLVQLEEDMRPDSIERAAGLVGSTRSPEVREVRRRLLENERKGVESLLAQTTQSRLRLEEDVRQAETLVLRMRQRVLPSIEKEIDKLNP